MPDRSAVFSAYNYSVGDVFIHQQRKESSKNSLSASCRGRAHRIGDAFRAAL